MKKIVLTLALTFLFVSFTHTYAQDTTELIKQLNLNETGEEKTEADTTKEFKLTEAKKKLIRRVLDILSDREVDDYLRAIGLSTSGTIYAKRDRLKEAVSSKDDKVKEDFPLPQDLNKKQESFVIENASEGELLSVDKTKSGVLILRGKVKIKIGQGHLVADSISVDSKKK